MCQLLRARAPILLAECYWQYKGDILLIRIKVECPLSLSVLVLSEGAFGGKPTSFYDLFRVENGKIAEHWDTIEPISDKKDWKNTNGKF